MKSNTPTDIYMNMEMPEHSTSKEPTYRRESLVYDLPRATTTSDCVIKVQDNAAYTLHKK